MAGPLTETALSEPVVERRRRGRLPRSRDPALSLRARDLGIQENSVTLAGALQEDAVETVYDDDTRRTSFLVRTVTARGRWRDEPRPKATVVAVYAWDAPQLASLKRATHVRVQGELVGVRASYGVKARGRHGAVEHAKAWVRSIAIVATKVTVDGATLFEAAK